MRVAFVSLRTEQLRSTGATRRMRRTAEGLAARGHEVTVLCARWWDGDCAAFERDGVQYRAVTDRPAPGAFASKLPLVLPRVNPEMIHADNVPSAAVSTAKATARLLRSPVVVDWWCDDETAANRRVARASDAVVTPSQTMKTRVREYGAAAEDVRVVPESIDASLVQRAPVDERADLVYARHLDEHANVESFLLALAELRDREWRAAVIGDGPARDATERIAADLRIDDRVEFLGDLPDEERVPILKGAHVFAHTATRTPFATDLLWALACGCVGIVEYQVDSSAHELVEGYDRGVRVTNPQELADEIEAAADVERRQFAEGFDDYDHDAVLDRYLDCYRDVASDYGLF